MAATGTGAMTMDAGPSLGEASGIFAGLVMLLAALGKGAAWLFNFKEAREKRLAEQRRAWEESEARRLQEWQASLDRREKVQREEAEGRISALEHRTDIMAAVLLEALGELLRLDPGSPVIVKMRIVLQHKVPVEADLPEEIRTLMRRMAAKDS